MRRRLVAMAIAGVLLLSVPASADLLPDPVASGLLAKIAVALKTWMDKAIREFDRLQQKIYNVHRFVAFPAELFAPIRLGITEIRTIRTDLERIACGWRFSPRTAYLRSIYFDHKVRLCKPSLRAIWGTSDPFIDRDLQEVQDEVATLTTNVLGSHARSHETFMRVFPEDFRNLSRDPNENNPGWAMREQAKLLASAGHVALANAQLVNQRLELEGLEYAAERREERLSEFWAAYQRAQLAGAPTGARGLEGLLAR